MYTRTSVLFLLFILYTFSAIFVIMCAGAKSGGLYQLYLAGIIHYIKK